MGLYSCLFCLPIIIFSPNVLFVVSYFLLVMGLFFSFVLLFMIALCDFGSIIICSRLLITGFLLFIDFISELIYVASCVIIIIIRGSTSLSIIAFSFVVVVLVSTSTFSWWAAELVSVYLDFLCPVSVTSQLPVAETV